MGLNPGIGSRKNLGGGLPSLPAVNTTSLAGRWQPNWSSVTKSGSRILTASDISPGGLYPLGEYNAASNTGFIEMTETDPTSPMFGRKFWRCDGSQAMEYQTMVNQTRDLGVIMVVRMNKCDLFTLFGLGTRLGSVNTNGATLRSFPNAGLAPWIYNANISGSTATTNKAQMIMGAQPQVIGLRSSTTFTNKMYHNQNVGNVALPTNVTGAVGGAFGVYPFSAGSIGSWAYMDIFDLLVYNAGPSDANFLASCTALQTGYGIPTVTDSMIIEGDSLEAGLYADATSGTWGDKATRYFQTPAGYRLILPAVAGNTTTDLATRLALANSVHDDTALIGGALSGHNRIAFQIGYNDAAPAGGSRTAANIYNEPAASNSIVSLVNGYKTKYDKIFSAVNISTGNSGIMTTLYALRVLLRDIATFRADTGTTSANLNLIDLPTINFGATYSGINGGFVFGTDAAAIAANANNMVATAIFQTDTVHLTGATSTGGSSPLGLTGNMALVQGGVPFGGSGNGLQAAFTL